VKLRLDVIDPNPKQPRKRFEGIAELAASIREHGLLEPLMVRPVGERYQIVHGERRWRACREAGLAEAEVIVRDVSEGEAYELALVENLQRQDLDPIEEAEAFAGLVAADWTQQRVAGLIGKSQQFVASRLVLLTLPGPVREMITTRVVTASHGEVLAGVKDPAEQVRLAERIATERLSVKALRGETADAIREANTEVIHAEGWTFTRPGPDGAFRMVRAPSGGKALFHRSSLQFDETGGEWTKLDLFTLGFLIPWPHKGQQDPEAWWWGDWSNYAESKGCGGAKEQIEWMHTAAEGIDFLLGLGDYSKLGRRDPGPLLDEIAATQLAGDG
jgi:ParB family chromosome partitioning protein